MEKRTFDEWNGERVKVKEEKPVIKRKRRKEATPKTVRLVLQKNLKLRIRGSVTGKEYLFPSAGSVLDVDERDAPGLLLKGQGVKSCCGSGVKAGTYFQQVE